MKRTIYKAASHDDLVVVSKLNRLIVLAREQQDALLVGDTLRAARATDLLEDQMLEMTVVQMRAAVIALCIELSEVRRGA